MLTAFVTVIHVFVSLALILLVLLHSGRGGGLSDMFGGGRAPGADGPDGLVGDHTISHLRSHHAVEAGDHL